MANFLGYYYSMIFGNVTVINTYSETEISEKLMRMCKDDVMIGISFPRYSKAAVFAVQTARKRGAKAIALTDSLISPLADSADYLLLARSGMASVVDSLVAPLGMINALIVATVLNRREEAEKTFNTLEEIWSQYKVYKKAERMTLLTKNKSVIVVGGGAAGLMSAIHSAWSGAEVIIFEKNSRPARKVLITGKGRCNVTNNCSIETVMNNTPTNPKFLYSALNRFSPEDTMSFFEMLE